MTKLCARGKAAAKRKFKVYPSAYANAYASKICAGKIKDPSGTKRKDWGPKKANKGLHAETKKVKNKDPRKGLEFKKGRPPKGSTNHLNNPVIVREAYQGKFIEHDSGGIELSNDSYSNYYGDLLK
jgi:hypothetical protein